MPSKELKPPKKYKAIESLAFEARQPSKRKGTMHKYTSGIVHLTFGSYKESGEPLLPGRKEKPLEFFSARLDEIAPMQSSM